MPTHRRPTRLPVDHRALRLARETAGLTREQIAARIGRSYSATLNYETGHSAPTNRVIVSRWAAACGVTVDSLLRDVVSGADQ